MVYVAIVILILQKYALHFILEKSHFSPLYYSYRNEIPKYNLAMWGSFFTETELLLDV